MRLHPARRFPHLKFEHMEPHQRQHVILAIVLAAAGVFLAIWGYPFLHQFGHEKLCIALYAILVIVFIYGRAEARHSPVRRPHA